MAKIALSLCSSTVAAMKESCLRIKGSYDLVEIRVDLLEKSEREHLKSFCKELKKENQAFLWTVRYQQEGGKFEGSEQERLNWLKKGDEWGAEWVDVEFKSSLKDIEFQQAKKILSYHDFNATPEAPEEILEAMKKSTPACIYKLAFACSSTTELLKVMKLYKSDSTKKGKVLAIAMSDWGELSRLMSFKLGAAWTYASDANLVPSAPGQYSVQELNELYRFRNADEATRLFVVVGNPISHSLSPYLHNAFFKDQKINALYGRVRADDFSAFVEIAKLLALDGASVTVPHKESLMSFLPTRHPLMEIGAANTLARNQEGQWSIYNTDIEAALCAIEEKLESGTRPRTLLLGAGGAGRALGWGVLEKKWPLTICNRTNSKAEKLAENLNALCKEVKFSNRQDFSLEGYTKVKTLSWENRSAENFDLAINTTTLGMTPNESESPLEKGFKKGFISFDSVYTPANTKFLELTVQAGGIAISGTEMFYRQAALQYSHWFKEPAPFEKMKEILECRSRK